MKGVPWSAGMAAGGIMKCKEREIRTTDSDGGRIQCHEWKNGSV